jgi:hypothetical protein
VTTPDVIKPKVQPGGLVTVAYLKARLDEGDDHLGIFFPLVLDVLPGLSNRHFTAAEVQEALAAVHGVAMPQEAVMTLLKRATRQHYLLRDAGRFQLDPAKSLPLSNVAGTKTHLEQGQVRLGEALQSHANRRDVHLDSPQAALNLLLRFLEEEQVGLLLGAPPNGDAAPTVSRRECAVMSEFLHDLVPADPALASVLSGLLEGLVLYHAAFLPDLSSVERSFQDLRVVFDSMLVRQALGYEGESPRILVRETVDLLKGSGVRCIVFDKTVHEIQRILSMYEDKLATPAGRRSLRPVPMARHFLTQRFSPSDVQEMSALLEDEIAAAGFRIAPTPARVTNFTADETALAERLADQATHDLTEPRIRHDVDCVAGVLTMRAGHRSRRVEETRVVFATTATLVIRNTRLWWEEDERETGVPPVVHIRSLANLAWLKKPATSASFQLRELVALCAAGMRPSQRTWRRFLEHLDALQSSQRLTADEVTAIIVSAMSDRFLREAELDEDDPDDLDTGTLDEVVARVKADYGAESEARIRELSDEYERRIAETADAAGAEASEAKRVADGIAETLRRRDLAIEGRARKWAARIVGAAYWCTVAVVVLGAAAVAINYTFHGGWLGALVGFSVVALALLELLGVLGHLNSLRTSSELSLRKKLRDWFVGEADNSAASDESNPTDEST